MLRCILLLLLLFLKISLLHVKHAKHIEINVIAVAIHLLLHDRAGTLASLLYKGKKPSVYLSVCLSALFSARTLLRGFSADRRQIYSICSVRLWRSRLAFKKVLIAVVHRLRRFERQGVDYFLLNFSNISVNRSPDAISS